MLSTLALILLGFPTQAADPPLRGWKEFSPKEGDFRVSMPGTPEEKSQTRETTDGVGKLTSYGIVREGFAYMIIRSDVPASVLAKGPKKVLDEARDQGVKKAGATLREEKAIELDGHPGREMVLDVPESRTRPAGIYRSRVYLVGRTHYSVIAFSSKSGDRSKEITSFLDSFRLK